MLRYRALLGSLVKIAVVCWRWHPYYTEKGLTASRCNVFPQNIVRSVMNADLVRYDKKNDMQI